MTAILYYGGFSPRRDELREDVTTQESIPEPIDDPLILLRLRIIYVRFVGVELKAELLTGRD